MHFVLCISTFNQFVSRLLENITTRRVQIFSWHYNTAWKNVVKTSKTELFAKKKPAESRAVCSFKQVISLNIGK